jgi:hypothetical protein
MRKLLFPLVLFSVSSCFAQSSCSETIHQALEAYGCLDSLKSFPAQIRSQAEAQMARDVSVKEEDKAAFVSTMVESVDVSRLIKNVESDMTSGCDGAQMKTVLEQIRTPLVQKMRALEAISGSPEQAAKMEKTLQLPDVQSPPPKRAALVKKLIDATGADTIAVEAAVTTSQSLLKGMGAPTSDPAQVAMLTSQIKENSYQQLSQMMLVVYHDATDEELERYVTLLETKPFREFNRSFGKAMVHSFGEESRQAGVALRRLYEERQAERERPKT